MMTELDQSLLIPDWSAPTHVVARASTRLGGVSQGPYASFNIALHVGDDLHHVDLNRQHLLSALDTDVKLQWINQVHGNRVVVAEHVAAGITGDALVTRQPGLACCIATADCLPILLTDRLGTVVAAAHGGWRGLVSGVLENTLAAMDIEPGECLVWLGPAIGPCHFEVGAEVRDSFLLARGPVTESRVADCFAAGKHDNKYMADLYGLARAKLAALGVTEVGGGGYCTVCDPRLFYSYRRQPTTGRMVSLIYRKN